MPEWDAGAEPMSWGSGGTGVQALGDPVRGLVPVEGREVRAAVVPLVEQQQLRGPGRLGHQPLRVLPGDETVAPPGHDKQRAADRGGAAGQGERRRHGPRGIFARRCRTHPERRPGQPGQLVPARAEVVGPGERDAHAHPLVAARDPRRVVTAQADTPDADPARVERGFRAQAVEDRGPRHLPVAADGQVVLGLALTGPVDAERGEPALEEQLFGGAELLLGRVEPGDQHHRRVRPIAWRGAEHTGEPRPLERDLDPPAWRDEERQRVGQAAHGGAVRGTQLAHVGDEQELGEVVVDGRAGQVGAGRQLLARGQCVPAELLVIGGDGAPGGTPAGPFPDAGRDPLEVRRGDPVGGEPRRPVRDRGGKPVIHAASRVRTATAPANANECIPPEHG